MTKEELEKEAEEKYSEVDREFIACQDEGEVFNIGYVLGAEPREKQIQIDAEQIRALQKQNGELTDELTDELTKAKQFIRDFLSVAVVYIVPIDKNYSLIAEAKQFLSEVEK